MKNVLDIPFAAARVRRLLLVSLATIASFAALLRNAHAQPAAERSPRWEFVVSSGRMIPTGRQRQSLEPGGLRVAQLSRIVGPSLAVTAALGWADTRNLEAPGDNRLDIGSADIGAELRGPRWGAARAVSFRPFAGLGAGTRRYDHRHLPIDVAYAGAAYGAAGGELGVRRIRLRLEARDYVTGRPPFSGGGPADARSDLALVAGVRWVAR